MPIQKASTRNQKGLKALEEDWVAFRANLKALLTEETSVVVVMLTLIVIMIIIIARILIIFINCNTNVVP